VFVISDMWCGIIDNCVAKANRDVTVGCYGSFDWLSHLLQYNPIVSLNGSLQWTEDPNSVNRKKSPVLFGTLGPPSVDLKTRTTFRNVQPGQIITAECRADFMFDLSTSYSGRNTYALNPLRHSCFINQTVHCKYLRFSPRLSLHFWIALKRLNFIRLFLQS